MKNGRKAKKGKTPTPTGPQGTGQAGSVVPQEGLAKSNSNFEIVKADPPRFEMVLRNGQKSMGNDTNISRTTDIGG